MNGVTREERGKEEARERRELIKRMNSDLIDAEGIVTDRWIETYYYPSQYIGQCDGYLRIIGDAGGYDFETRIINDALIYWGWTPPTKEVLEAKKREFEKEQL